MLWYAAAAALALWLLLLGYAAVAARPRWTRPAPPSLALRAEPPAVVSLLAGRADRDAFPATVLDLAARGWLVLDHRSSGQPVAGLTGPSGWLVDGGKLVLECPHGMVSVRLDGGLARGCRAGPHPARPGHRRPPAVTRRTRRRPGPAFHDRGDFVSNSACNRPRSWSVAGGHESAGRGWRAGAEVRAWRDR